MLYISDSNLESSTFPRSPGYFHWRVLLETKFWGLGVPIAPNGAQKAMCIY